MKGQAPWRPAALADLAALADFVRPREMWAAGFSGKVFGLGPGHDEARLALPRGGGSGLYLLGEKGKPVLGAVLFSRSGSALPVLDAASVEDAGLGELASLRAGDPYRAGACIGPASQARALELAMGWKAALGVAYYSMARPRASVDLRAPPGFRLGKADAADADRLMPLAMAYEREEVLTPIHAFSPEACRAGQAQALRRQTVYAIWLGKQAVARAQTNAVGLGYEQMGGVYVVPHLRGKGLGRAVVSALIADIASRGKSCCLFVKQGNLAARKLYASLGFSEEGEFLVDYFA